MQVLQDGAEGGAVLGRNVQVLLLPSWRSVAFLKPVQDELAVLALGGEPDVLHIVRSRVRRRGDFTPAAQVKHFGHVGRQPLLGGLVVAELGTAVDTPRGDGAARDVAHVTQVE